MGSSNETSFFGPVVSRGGARAPTRRWCRAARPAARRWRWPPTSALARPVPIPAARSASRPLSPAPSESSRPTAAARAGASWRLPHRSIRPDRSPRTVRDAAILLTSMAGHDPKDTTSVDRAGAGLRGGGRSLGQRHEDRHAEGIPDARHAGRDRSAVAAGQRVAEGRRRRDRRGFAAAHQVRAAGLLHRRAGGSLVQPRALRRRALRAAGARPRHHRHL